jgi:carboxyl-terminal processing protease
MFQKGKVVVFWGSALIVLYGITAAFYGKVAAKDDAYKQLVVFMDALRKIKDDYVEAPDMNKVQEGAMRGLVDALDSHSSFLTKEQLDAVRKRDSAGKANVGIVVSKRSDVMYVVSVQRNGSADSAGIRAGDYLVAVDNQSVDDKSILEAESMLRGSAGSAVKLTVFRGTRTKPLDFELTRKAETAPAINSRMLNGGVGVLDISSLAGISVDEVRLKLKTLVSAGAQKLILDIRDCADGNPTDGAALANLFVREGVIYYSQNRDGQKVQEVTAAADKFVTDMPMAVLINGSTAGAAEIAAGALKDNKRAQIVGERSFGIGSAQKEIQLKSGAVIFLSVAKYYTPGGKMIEDDDKPRNAGIKPDVQSPDEDKLQSMMVESYYDDQNGNGNPEQYRQLKEKIDQIQLDKALEVLTKEQVPAKRAA